MTVLDWFMTRDTTLRYVFVAFLMLAILAIMIFRYLRRHAETRAGSA